MSGPTLITALTIGFGLISAAIVLAVLHRYRRAPIIFLMRSVDRRIGVHRDALTALDVALAGARVDGNRTMFDFFTQQYRYHRAALLALDPKAGPSAATPAFDEAVHPAVPARRGANG